MPLIKLNLFILVRLESIHPIKPPIRTEWSVSNTTTIEQTRREYKWSYVANVHPQVRQVAAGIPLSSTSNIIVVKQSESLDEVKGVMLGCVRELMDTVVERGTGQIELQWISAEGEKFKSALVTVDDGGVRPRTCIRFGIAPLHVVFMRLARQRRVDGG
ncbi:hypothetical protein CC86DRAFT_470542 [Ophiobolus disseminans]|uniref:Uncharacterized protein n=1 Tax=Ophiobolus disseminans TaxID=1469910 RepID=A0A6A6ZJS6_9PLEO|nr:hypothetical protein CC86DRAFT_470542 [Ophiobolus disseminans]